MIGHFLVDGQPAPANTLIVDCGRADGVLTLSHWRGAPAPPPDVRADTSTGLVLAFAAAHPERLRGFSVVANDHLDADGLLAMAAAAEPSLALAHGDLLERTAAAGDFAAWPDTDGLHLLLVLHRWLAQARAAGQGWESRCAALAPGELARWLAAARDGEPARTAAVTHIHAVRARLQRNEGFTSERLGDLVQIGWQRVHGHAWDQFTAEGSDDDLPVWALGDLYPDTCFQLLAEAVPGGHHCVVEAPRHSWAQTSVRPTVRWPDLQRAARRLQAMETAACRWIHGQDARRIAFCAVLAAVDVHGVPAPSALPPATVAAAVREALRAR